MRAIDAVEQRALVLFAMTFRFAYRRYTVAFRTPVKTAHNLWSERTGIIVRLGTEVGRRGYGETSPIPWFGTETTVEAENVCRSFGDFVLDEQITEIPERLACLRCGLRAARNEALREQKSAAEENADAYFPVAALLPAGKAALSKIDGLAETGFRTFKWKVGVADLADEIVLLDDLLGRLPSGAKLRLDANGAWDRRKAERWLERCADRPIEFVEQPVAPDLRGSEDLLLGLAGDYPTRIALDESITVAGEIERWLRLGWKGVYVVKPQLLGDVASVLAALAKSRADVVFSSALETGIGARDALNAAFDFPGERRALGFGVWPLFADSRFDGPIAAPFIRRTDLDYLNPETVWNVLG